MTAHKNDGIRVKYHRFENEQYKATDAKEDIIQVVDAEGYTIDQIKLEAAKKPTCVDNLCQQHPNNTHMPGYRLVEADRFEQFWQRSI